MLTHSAGDINKFGTPDWPLPKLYVPTEAFVALENDLTALIVFHEANHAKVYRNGFGFVTINDLKLMKQQNFISEDIFYALIELEGNKEQIERGSSMMSGVSLENVHQTYLMEYLKLFRYGVLINEQVSERLKVNYFQTWMNSTKSLRVYEKQESSGVTIEYGGAESVNFLVNAPNKSGVATPHIHFFLKKLDSRIYEITMPLPSAIGQR